MAENEGTIFIFHYKPKVRGKNALPGGYEHHDFTAPEFRCDGEKMLFGEVVYAHGLWWRKPIYVIISKRSGKSPSVNGFDHFFTERTTFFLCYIFQEPLVVGNPVCHHKMVSAESVGAVVVPDFLQIPEGILVIL